MLKTVGGGTLKVSIMGKDMVLTDETKVRIAGLTSSPSGTRGIPY